MLEEKYYSVREVAAMGKWDVLRIYRVIVKLELKLKRRAIRLKGIFNSNPSKNIKVRDRWVNGLGKSQVELILEYLKSTIETQ